LTGCAVLVDEINVVDNQENSKMDKDLVEPAALARGREIRRQVLGETHVSHSHAVDALSQPKTRLSEYVWSRIWARPGLTLKQRSIANLSMLTALNRPRELRLHINGALNNGLTKEEISEVLLQTGVYCGLPAAEESMRIMQDVFKQRPD
jgi:4-carboxymuconolactone decarboxylase